MDSYAFDQMNERFEKVCVEIDDAKSISEIRHILKYSGYPYDKRQIEAILSAHEGKIKQVGHKFTKLKENIKQELWNQFHG